MLDGAILVPDLFCDALLSPAVHFYLFDIVEVVQLRCQAVADSVQLLALAVVHDDRPRQLLLYVSVLEHSQPVVAMGYQPILPVHLHLHAPVLVLPH